MRFLRCMLAGALLLLGSAPPAWADETRPALPDVVVLKNGGMLRGSIVEMDPTGKVSILLPSGETRTLQMADVTYAGPESGRPGQAPAGPKAAPAPPPPAPAPSNEVRVALEADQPGATFHVRTATSVMVGWNVAAVGASYKQICAGPCEVTLPLGTHDLAMALPRQVPVMGDNPVRIDGPSLVQGKYDSNAGLRTGGFIVIFGGITLGLVIAMVPVLSSDSPSKIDRTPVYVGVGVAAASSLVGLLLIMQRDHVTFQVTPMPVVAGGPEPWRNNAGAVAATETRSGIGLKISF